MIIAAEVDRVRLEKAAEDLRLKIIRESGYTIEELAAGSD